MDTLRLLLVEDSEQEIETFKDIIEDYRIDNERDIDLVVGKTLDEALTKFDSSFDGAIIDLKLGDETEEGNKVVEKIIDSFYRIPIAIYAAIPSYWDESLSDKIMLIDVFIKSETTFDIILDKFWEIYNTGLTHIMGGRGRIEQCLNEVFLKNLLPQIKKWISYGDKDPELTEKALLRYTLNHLLQLLEEDEDCFPEEVYLYPSVLDRITTGSIVKIDDQWFVVLSPACDLVPRGENEVRNTDYILLVEIESVDKVLSGSKSKGKVRELCTNKRDFYHWLPETDFFQGGILDFRKLKTLNEDRFEEKFGKPTIQVSPSFVKDIVSRFSSYYARQGQPDIDSTDFVKHYTT